MKPQIKSVYLSVLILYLLHLSSCKRVLFDSDDRIDSYPEWVGSWGSDSGKYFENDGVAFPGLKVKADGGAEFSRGTHRNRGQFAIKNDFLFVGQKKFTIEQIPEELPWMIGGYFSEPFSHHIRISEVNPIDKPPYSTTYDLYSNQNQESSIADYFRNAQGIWHGSTDSEQIEVSIMVFDTAQIVIRFMDQDTQTITYKSIGSQSKNSFQIRSSEPDTTFNQGFDAFSENLSFLSERGTFFAITSSIDGYSCVKFQLVEDNALLFGFRSKVLDRLLHENSIRIEEVELHR